MESILNKIADNKNSRSTNKNTFAACDRCVTGTQKVREFHKLWLCYHSHIIPYAPRRAAVCNVPVACASSAYALISVSSPVMRTQTCFCAAGLNRPSCFSGLIKSSRGKNVCVCVNTVNCQPMLKDTHQPVSVTLPPDLLQEPASHSWPRTAKVAKKKVLQFSL